MGRARKRAEVLLGIDPRANVRGRRAMYQTKYCTVYTFFFLKKNRSAPHTVCVYI
jgi:hypothetical protein